MPLVVLANGAAQDPATYSVGAIGLILFNSASALKAVITVTCGFYFQCRFEDDSVKFSESLNGFWEKRKSLKFSSVKL